MSGLEKRVSSCCTDISYPLNHHMRIVDDSMGLSDRIKIYQSINLHVECLLFVWHFVVRLPAGMHELITGPPDVSAHRGPRVLSVAERFDGLEKCYLFIGGL